MDKKIKCCLNCAIFSILLSLILCQLAKFIATDEERNNVGNINTMSLKEKIMHLLIHNADEPIISSVLIGLLVFCACLIGYMIPLFH